MAREIEGRLWGYDQQATFGAKAEIVSRGLLALGKRLVGNDYQARGQFFGLRSYILFARADEGRHQYSAICRAVKPLLPGLFKFLGAVGSVDNHPALEGVVKEVDIAISLAGNRANQEIVSALKKIGESSPYRQAIGIRTEIAIDSIEAAIFGNYLIVKALGKNARGSGSLIDHIFKAPYLPA